jgi:hypothetical protein
MTTAKFVGNNETSEYLTKVFHAAPGNEVSMPDEIWDNIKSKGDDKLFTNVQTSDETFGDQKTVFIPRK